MKTIVYQPWEVDVNYKLSVTDAKTAVFVCVCVWIVLWLTTKVCCWVGYLSVKDIFALHSRSSAQRRDLKSHDALHWCLHHWVTVYVPFSARWYFPEFHLWLILGNMKSAMGVDWDLWLLSLTVAVDMCGPLLFNLYHKYKWIYFTTFFLSYHICQVKQNKMSEFFTFQ